MKHQIKHRYINSVLFECDLPDDTHAKEYRAALDLIQCHAGLWTPPTN